jgi:hypothetical protein
LVPNFAQKQRHHEYQEYGGDLEQSSGSVDAACNGVAESIDERLEDGDRQQADGDDKAMIARDAIFSMVTLLEQ